MYGGLEGTSTFSSSATFFFFFHPRLFFSSVIFFFIRDFFFSSATFFFIRDCFFHPRLFFSSATLFFHPRLLSFAACVKTAGSRTLKSRPEIESRQYGSSNPAAMAGEDRRFHGRQRHLGCGANTAKCTVNVWEKSSF